MTRLAIIHTTPATIDSLKALALELIPGCEVINFVDDSILPRLAGNGGNLAEVEERLIAYARFAQAEQAEIILEACSSVGEVVSKMQAAVTIPVVRIDAAMAEAAVRQAGRIGVAATLPTTLQPTMRLLQEKAAASGKQVEMHSRLIEGAFTRLMAGDLAGHDALLVEGLSSLAGFVDVVVLAQASMARVVSQLPAGEQEKFLSSPRSGMLRVKSLLENKQDGS
jgi:glutamate racemase